MTQVTYDRPEVNEVIASIASNPKLSSKYQAAFMKIAVMLNEFPLYDINISKLKDRYANISIDEFPVEEIEKNGEDMLAYMVKDAIRTVATTHTQVGFNSGISLEAFNEGMESNITQLLYPHEAEIQDESVIMNAICRLTENGSENNPMIEAYFTNNPTLAVRSLLNVDGNVEQLKGLLNLIEQNFKNKGKEFSKLGEIEKMLIDIASKKEGLNLNEFVGNLVTDSSYCPNPEFYRSVDDVTDYAKQVMTNLEPRK